MTDTIAEERKRVADRLEIAREKLHATGATALSPTAEWIALQKEVSMLKRKLK